MLGKCVNYSRTISQQATVWTQRKVAREKEITEIQISHVSPRRNFFGITHDHIITHGTFASNMLLTVPLVPSCRKITQHLHIILFEIDPQHPCCCIRHAVDAAVCPFDVTVPLVLQPLGKGRTNFFYFISVGSVHRGIL